MLLNTHGRRNERGTILVVACLGVIGLIGVAALTVDIGRLVIAAQVAQDMADAAALGAGRELPEYSTAQSVALDLVAANNKLVGGFPAICSPDDGDITFWDVNETVPGFGELGGVAWAMQVTTHVPVAYIFARLVGLEGATISRSCTVVRMPIGGVPICPMWINYGTDYLYGQQQNLLMADGPHYENIPGSFGWLEPPSGDKNTFSDLLRDYQVPAEMVAANYVSIDGIVTARTGVAVGHWRKALETAPDGLARLERATWEQWAGNTFECFRKGNPRLMLVPMVEYLGGNGANAEFLIHAFGAFWLESVDSYGQPKSVTGRFIQYNMPGAGGDALSPETGLWTVKMVQ